MSNLITPMKPPDQKSVADHHNELTAEIIAAVQNHQSALPLALIVGTLHTLAMDFHATAFQQQQLMQLELARRAEATAAGIRGKMDG